MVEKETVFSNVEVVIPGDAETAYDLLCKALASIAPAGDVWWETDTFIERDANSGEVLRLGPTDEVFR